MRTLRFIVVTTAFLASAGAVLAQASSSTPLVTDRPGFMFGSTTVGPRVFQVELGLPQVTLFEFENVKARATSAVALLRYGIGDNFELRLGAPVYTWTRVEVGRFTATDSGYGDLEVGAKWHLVDNAGARPSFALIPSVILPTGQHGFTAEDPIYQLNAAAEWALADGWGLSALAGYLNGPSDGDRYGQETFGLSLGRNLTDQLNVYGEAAYFATDLDGFADTSFLGAGLKYLVSNDLQLDASFDRGMTDESPDWLLGLGLSYRFH
jgi:hypothetical protein